jgi:hypothetical protein
MGSDKHSYHIIRSDGTEADIKGDDVHIGDSGVLSITNHMGDLIAAFAPHAWSFVEPEKRDDSEDDVDRPDRISNR